MGVPTPDDFLRRVADYVMARMPASRPVRFATIDPAYAASSYPGTLPRVTFDGEDALTAKGYAVAGPYLPSPGDRVMLVPAGITYAIVGGVSGAGRIYSAPTRGNFNESVTLITGISATGATPGVGGEVFGFNFTSPPSGQVEITLSAMVRSGADSRATYCSYQVFEGANETGTLKRGPDYRRSVMAGRAVTASGPAENCASHGPHPLAGLTPGVTHYIRAVHWVSGGTAGSIDYRSLYVKPIV